jgi:alpha/beta superfamily hydrolase
MTSLLSQRSKKTQLSGPAGNIEALYAQPEQPKPYIAVICHPHPLHGGTMTNKVVTTLAKTLDTFGATTLRFNYRGVGASDGEYDHAIGEYDDLIAMTHWLRTQHPGSQLILAGFSFGSFLVAKAAAACQPALLITVAPAIKRQAYGDYPQYAGPWCLIQGDEDELTPASTVYAWADQHPTPPSIMRIPDASHFFHGKLGDIEARLGAYLVDKLS